MKAYCGYYALANYMGKSFFGVGPSLSLRSFKKQVYAQYQRDLGLPKASISAFIAENGVGMEGLAVNQYHFQHTQDLATAAANGRFVASVLQQNNEGHWITYIQSGDGDWWEYDSWQAAPTHLGDRAQLQRRLRSFRRLYAMYYRQRGTWRRRFFGY